MPLIKGDVKGLEVVAIAWVSKDPVLVQEINNKEDIHGNNQKHFNFPDRLTAKIFKFRMIYGGDAYSYSLDPDFTFISSDPKFWQRIIDEYYYKYKGIKQYHEDIIRTVMEQGFVRTASGRVLKFYKTNRFGYDEYPITDIKNYPIQSLGADLVCQGRVNLYFKNKWLSFVKDGKLVSTVHDDIRADVPTYEVEKACKCIKKSIEEIPEEFSKYFGVNFDLPLSAEISVGPNMAELEVIKI